jgi:hypothetical protein
MLVKFGPVQLGKNFDPLVLEDFDWNNEWVDPLANSYVVGDDPLFTWEHVDHAIGASTQLQGRYFPRRAYGTQLKCQFLRMMKMVLMWVMRMKTMTILCLTTLTWMMKKKQTTVVVVVMSKTRMMLV